MKIDWKQVLKISAFYSAVILFIISVGFSPLVMFVGIVLLIILTMIIAFLYVLTMAIWKDKK